MVNNIKSRNLTQQRDNSSQENDYIREDNERKKSKKPIGIHAHKKRYLIRRERIQIDTPHSKTSKLFSEDCQQKFLQLL